MASASSSGIGPSNEGREINRAGMKQLKNILSLGIYDFSPKIFNTAKENGIKIISYLDDITGRIIVDAYRFEKLRYPVGTTEIDGQSIMLIRDGKNKILSGYVQINQHLRAKVTHVPKVEERKVEGKDIPEVPEHFIYEKPIRLGTNKQYFEYIDSLTDSGDKKEKEEKVSSFSLISERLARNINVKGEIVTIRDKISKGLIQKLYSEARRVPKCSKEHIEEYIVSLNAEVDNTEDDYYYLAAIAASNTKFKNSFSGFVPKAREKEKEKEIASSAAAAAAPIKK